MNGEDYYDTLWESNVIGTKNILRWQETMGFRMIFSSSSEVYGDYEGVMREDVMDRCEIKQLNDYAMTKWVNELQILNSTSMKGTETVRVRLFNTYGPGEFYSPYRSVNCVFCYHLLHNLPITVYGGHKRTSTYVADAVRALANISDYFKPGEVYNVGGGEYHDIETLAEHALQATCADRSLVSYKDSEPFTTKEKRIDNTKAVRDLNFGVTVSLEEGVKRTVEWMRKVYQPDSPELINLDVINHVDSMR
jgi:dTDP-glucose 4,6-dehydratase